MPAVSRTATRRGRRSRRVSWRGGRLSWTRVDPCWTSRARLRRQPSARGVPGSDRANPVQHKSADSADSTPAPHDRPLPRPAADACAKKTVAAFTREHPGSRGAIVMRCRGCFSTRSRRCVTEQRRRRRLPGGGTCARARDRHPCGVRGRRDGTLRPLPGGASARSVPCRGRPGMGRHEIGGPR